MKFPIQEFRETFTPHFQEDDLQLTGIFSDICDILEGIRDPWRKLNKLKLRLFHLGDEDFEFEDWLINAGQFFLILKSYILTGEDLSLSEISPYTDWFQDSLDAAKQDLLDDEVHILFSFYCLAEFMKLYVFDEIQESFIEEFKVFLDDFNNDVELLPDLTKSKVYELIIPYFLDAMKLHPEKMDFLLTYLDDALYHIEGDLTKGDESAGLAVRSLAFRNYEEASSDYQFEWAADRLQYLKDPFIGLTSAINVAIGHSLRGEQEASEALLSKNFTLHYQLPAPKKQIHMAFLMRGAFEARLEGTGFFKDLRIVHEEMLENTIETIEDLTDSLNDMSLSEQVDLNEVFESLEMTFIVLSAILDNWGLGGVHVNDPRLLMQVDMIVEKIEEINLVLNFKSKLMIYHEKLRPEGDGKWSQKRNKFLIDARSKIENILKDHVEHMFLDDLYDFFIEHSKNCLEIAYLTQDESLIKHLSVVFELIVEKAKGEEEGKETVQYQLMSAMSNLVNMMWNNHFKLSLLQGFLLNSFE